MRLNVGLYRVVQVPTEHLKAAVGLEMDASSDLAAEKLREKFGVLTPGVRIFWAADEWRTTIVGIKTVWFDARDASIPQAGVVSCDPLFPEDIHRADGALQATLLRFGITTRPEEYEWRCWWELKGEDR